MWRANSRRQSKSPSTGDDPDSPPPTAQQLLSQCRFCYESIPARENVSMCNCTSAICTGCLERELYLTINRGDLQARCTVCGFTHKISQAQRSCICSALSIRASFSTALLFARFCYRACLPQPHRNLTRQGKIVLFGIAVFVCCNVATFPIESTPTQNTFTVLLVLTQQTLVFWTAAMVSLQLQEFWRMVILCVYIVKFIALCVINKRYREEDSEEDASSSPGIRRPEKGGVLVQFLLRTYRSFRTLPDISLFGFALCILVLAFMLLVDLFMQFEHEMQRQRNSRTRVVYVNSMGPFKISRLRQE